MCVRNLAASILLLICIGCHHRVAPVSEISNDTLELITFDCGYGDALLLSLQNRHIVIDGGYPSFGPEFLDYLKDLGIHSIDAIFLTHPHPDHIGGAFAVVQSDLSVESVFSCYPIDHGEIPSGFREQCLRRSIPWRPFCRGAHYMLGTDCSIDALHPVAPGPNLNDSSLVLAVRFGSAQILLTADIGSHIQAELARDSSIDLRCDVLKSAHHGGEFDFGFLRTAGPDHVIVSVGMNPYGNPWPEHLMACRMLGASVYRTDESGSIRCRISRNGEVRVERLDRD